MRLFTGESPVVPRPPDIDVGVIYTYEQNLMHRLVSSLHASGNGLQKRLILVDNASAAGGRPWTGYFSDTRVLRNVKRLPYSANLNHILRASLARYVLLLNTDMFFDPREQCVSKMVRFMEGRPDCGIAGCRLHHGNGVHAPSARRFQRVSTIFARRLGLGQLMQRTLESYFYQEHPKDGVFECDWLSGCFMMVRREAIRDVGYFDVRFEKYFEDVDMCLRMARAGWRVMYNGSTYCYHLERRASKRLFSADARKHARAYLRWLMKWGFSPDRYMLPEREERRRAA